MKNKRKVLIFGLFLLLITAASAKAASSADDNTRYFVQTTKGFWKNTLSARNVFEDGFTADLSDWQLKLAKLAGVKVVAVRKLSILPDTADASAKRILPTEQVPWNVSLIYHETPEKTSGGKGVKVAILDTGVDKNHPDLTRRIKECNDFTSNKDSLVKDECTDLNGHGTHIAGIVAADGGEDGQGIYGMAPDADVLAFKVCSATGTCWSDDVAHAIRVAVDDGAQIINISLGSDTQSSLIEDAIQYAVDKDVLVVAAAGNDGPYTGSIDYPAADPNVMGVSALDASLNVPDWSSRGNNTKTKPFVVDEGDVEIAMPGVNIESTWNDGGYGILSGTSMAAPHAAGLAAKLWQKDDPHPADATRKLIHTLAHDLAPAGDDNSSGWGIPTL